MNKYYTVISLSLLVVLLDQITKALVRSSLSLFEKIPLLPFLNLTHVRNRGAAFGILNNLPEEVRLPLFVAIFAVAILVIFFFLKKTKGEENLLILSLSLILGGAVGNSIDRLRLGYVTDFVDLHWFGNPKYHWPAFNAADSAITIGVALIIIETLILKRQAKDVHRDN